MTACSLFTLTVQSVFIVEVENGSQSGKGGAFLLGNTSEGNAENQHAFVGCMAEVSVWKKVLGGELCAKCRRSPS